MRHPYRPACPETCRDRERTAAARTADAEVSLAVGKVACLQERYEIGGMVSVKVTDCNMVEIFEAGACLAEAKKRTASEIDEDPGLVIRPNDVTCR